MLHIERVTPDNAGRLVRYSAERGAEHDGSYLPGTGFRVVPEQPSYLLVEGEAVVGAASLMITPRYTRIGAGRFAIFHAAQGSSAAYAMLFAAVQPHLGGLRKVYLFLPEKAQATAAILTGLGFHIERYSYVLRKAPAVPGRVVWPEGAAVRALAPDDAVGGRQFAECLNDSFARLAGHADLSADDVRSFFDEPEHLQGGIRLLEQDGAPIGTVMVMRDSEDAGQAEVTALGIVTAQQGRGLGRRLLRHAVDFAVRRGFGSVVLSVNAENETALWLYRSEGFAVIDTMVCYAQDVPQEGPANPGGMAPPIRLA